CYTFAEMPWYQRRIAKMLFATPPSSTYEKALGYFHRAEQVDPNFYSKNLLLLGKTYLKLHNKKLAAFWLMKAKDYPAHTEEDKQEPDSPRVTLVRDVSPLRVRPITENKPQESLTFSFPCSPHLIVLVWIPELTAGLRCLFPHIHVYRRFCVASPSAS
ncbi:RMDN1 isoform 1, partial [Pan troglodytes]